VPLTPESFGQYLYSAFNIAFENCATPGCTLALSLALSFSTTWIYQIGKSKRAREVVQKECDREYDDSVRQCRFICSVGCKSDAGENHNAYAQALVDWWEVLILRSHTLINSVIKPVAPAHINIY